MSYQREYNLWLKKVSAAEKDMLRSMSQTEIEEAFCKNLDFGTGGLRGIMGLGTNRMNIYTVRKATQGLANEISELGDTAKKQGVVIAYDSRNNSYEFAFEAAKVLCANGIKTYLFDSLRPTPELSFSVRYLNCIGGVVITASHNPAKYNGYKVYWSDGGQIPPEIARKILNKINNIDVFNVDEGSNEQLIEYVGEEIDNAYIESVYMQSVNPDVKKDNFKLVYTPLHGSGNKPVRKILKRSGFENVIVVKCQEKPDGNFPTVKSPNPENKECFDIAIDLAKENNVDLIIGTDPDSDRMGIVVKNKSGEYVTMTGNQVGIMLLDYILSSQELPKNPAVVTTIVSTRMADIICEKYSTKLFRTLTGFKFIGEKIHEFERDNSFTFMFGFEESYGYLKGTYCRDKDAVVASMLTAEMAAYYAEQGLTLYEVMNNLYEQYGGYYEELESITFEGIEGAKKIKQIMRLFRENTPDRIGECKIEKLTDYLKDTDLPKSDVLYFELDNDVHFVVRPSGTEPKVKIYYLSKGVTFEDAKIKATAIKEAVNAIMK
ncbi:MAG: phospho-sugar mutase [Firmicutes bacterium]|nr:phospho-sugar mutase [Bacillota bacterium]